ncbi:MULTISPECIES: serine/threonine-protein kinase [unclassified Microbacterium]|uniref:serine/threonine-protein kinase n=1 Tax=unclassified Microbacterium TaxID=2609290 RepID=UPI00214CFEC0|nr:MULTISPECIES: serine/threonine-protein kinase [unclassified Microbacterium]MCR2784267.1 serine/threonine protein kinase [Microbacterium sp. zg.B96]WIM14904.1 serine/threonine-protein kinase [Microbacterium sp. zg-B96]
MTAKYGPVDIPGFTLARPLGSGGFADVFLYDQHLPRRLVAVKIMHEPVDDPAARTRFETEANLMAALSTHPSIVTIHHAAVADNGRPYLVMEYCSRPTLAETYPARVVSVPELLQTLIRLCGAVETAHRAGILHRDIKPANVLTTDYGWPALTDFGLSSIAGASADAGGVSVPWAAPELVTGRGFDARSDVYALAATAYTVLAGRSPFDAAHAPADLSELVTRVLTTPAPPIGRDDVPAALERLILASLAKDPDRRSQTASEFARSLQRIEQDLHLPMTHLDIPAVVPPTAVAAADAGTNPHDADPAEPTQFAARRRVEPEEKTVLSARAVPEPPAPPVADEPTRLTGPRRRDSRPDPSEVGYADEPTRLLAGDPQQDTDPAAPPLTEPPASSRRAHDPGAEALPRETYGIRSVPATPVVRAAPAAPATPEAPGTAAVAPPAGRRRQGVAMAVAIGATVLVIAASVAAIALLAGM